MTSDQIKEEVELSLCIAKGSFYKKPEFGHRFKELARCAASEKTRRRAETYAKETLQWMIDVKHLKSLSCSAIYDEDYRLLVTVECVPYIGKEITFSRFVEVGDVCNS